VTQGRDDDVDRSPEKDPDEWVTGEEPMTRPQRSYLRTLAREAGEEVPDDITKAEASKRIDELPTAGPAWPRRDLRRRRLPWSHRHRSLAAVVRDMSQAQSPRRAARALPALVAEPEASHRGEIVQFGRIIPWR
jgi:hypothetical protein